MPGRPMVGLSPDEKHPAEFRTKRLRDDPQISLERVLIGVLLGLIVLGTGYYLRSDLGRSSGCNDPNPRNCSPPIGRDVPMIVWLSVAALVITLVIAWPYLAAEARRWVGRD